MFFDNKISHSKKKKKERINSINEYQLLLVFKKLSNQMI